jgi:cytidylate kinase
LPGSGAEELGHCLAEKLDYGFFGIEIVDQIAREAGVQRHLVAGLDEQERSLIDRHFSDVFRPERFTQSDYLRHLVRVVVTLGGRGMAVILGRGSPFILSGERALRVLVVAPRSARIRRLAQVEGTSEEEAARRLSEAEAERREFLEHHFQVNPDDPTLYELVVNTEMLGIEGAAEVVVDAHRRRVQADRRAKAPPA